MSQALDLRHGPSHRPPRLTADVAALRLEHLLLRGFTAEAADKIFEAVDLPAIDNIDRKLEDLRGRGFADPVKMITS